MPAAAVIPAPIAYIKVVAVKKLVVGSRVQASSPCSVAFRSGKVFVKLLRPVSKQPVSSIPWCS